MSTRHRPLSLQSLRAFEAVARRLSFRLAGEELFLTQSAISRQIKGLEDELGSALFVRGTRHVVHLLADVAGVLGGDFHLLHHGGSQRLAQFGCQCFT